jgi:hypothetical protein
MKKFFSLIESLFWSEGFDSVLRAILYPLSLIAISNNLFGLKIEATLYHWFLSLCLISLLNGDAQILNRKDKDK